MSHPKSNSRIPLSLTLLAGFGYFPGLLIAIKAMRHPSSGTLSIFGAGAFMDINGHWKKLVAVALAAVALVGQSFIGYVTENGQLPPWMPERLGGIAGWLSTDFSIPYWLLVLALVCLVGLGVMYTKFQSRTVDGLNARLVSTHTALSDSEQRYRSVQVANAHLESSCADLRQLLEKPQVPEVVEAEVSAAGLKALRAMERYIDHDMKPTLAYIAGAISLGNVEASAVIDELIEKSYISKYGTVRGIFYRFTPAGRAFYLKHK